MEPISRKQVIERLRNVDLGGGSHESLSAIAKAVYEPAGGWTIIACECLRQTLVRLIGGDTEQGGRITDELRKYIGDMVTRGISPICKESLAAIADRIDAEHEEALGSKVAMAISVGEDGTEFVSMPAKELSERYVELPKDADGEYIHMGDLVTVPWEDKVYEVAGFSCTKQLCSGIRTIWIDVYSPEKQRNVSLCRAGSCRHYHAPTVEDVLREMADRIYADEDEPRSRDAIVAEYAAKLRLADDGKEQ